MGTVRYTVIDGEIIAEKRNGVRKQYVPDPLGSTVALLDNTQTQTDTFTYWPYGEVASRTGTTPTPFQYVGTRGCRQDSASKTYMRARILDTPKGRWLTQDPIGFDGGDINLYRYVANNPITLSDFSGYLTQFPRKPLMSDGAVRGYTACMTGPPPARPPMPPSSKGFKCNPISVPKIKDKFCDWKWFRSYCCTA